MAQFIDPTNTELAKFPTWRAHTGRQLAREISGVRGCAPAIHFHDTVNDNETSSAKDIDDRIFTVYTGDRIHVWGQEMWIQNTRGDGVSLQFDSLNIYYRAHGSTSESDWLLVKGTSVYGKQSATPTEFHPNANLSGFNSALPYYNGGDGKGTSYYGPTGSSPPQPNKFSYLIEEIVLGYNEGVFYGAGGGSSYKNMDGNSNTSAIYNQASMTNVRCFSFTREGQYKLEIDETWSWKAGSTMPAKTTKNNYYADATTVAAGQTDKWKRNNLFEPVDYTSNTGLYGTLPEQLKSFTGLSQTYRSNFTKKIIVNAYNHSKDLVTKTTISKPTNITLTANAITTGTVITKPYQKVIGYGAVFQHITDGYFIGGTAGEYTGTTTASERFGKINQRWNGAGQRLINRRHLWVEGLTVRGDTDLGKPSDLTAPIETTNTDLLDLRGSVFRDCVFEDMNLNADQSNVIWGGTKFINCTFKRCVVNMQADSVLFIHCFFQESAKTEQLNSSGISSAYINCEFEGLSSLFTIDTNNSPCTDNFWFRCHFDSNVFDSAVKTSFGSTQTKSALLNAVPTGKTLLEKQKLREFSRNMFIANRVMRSDRFIIGNDNSFSRANFYTLNEISKCLIQTNINSTNNTSTTELSGGSYYDIHYWNSYSELRVILGENTCHFRFLNNHVYETGFYSKSELQPTPIFSIVSNYENPKNGSVLCKHTSRSFANKIIGNVITGWDRYFPKEIGSPCSIYLNFYNPIGCQTCHAEQMWGNNKASGANGYFNEMLDKIDLFDSSKGKYINIAYKNILKTPTPQSWRNNKTLLTSQYGVYADYCDPTAAYRDGINLKGTGSPKGNLAEGQEADICREDPQTFNCNSIFFGTGTSYPTISSDANSSYYKVSIPHDGYFNDEREDNTNSDGGGVKKSLFKYINSFSTLQ